jgi:HEAT repeat protein
MQTDKGNSTIQGGGPASAGTAAGPLEKVRLVIKALCKYLSGKKLYASNNPMLQEFAGELKASLRAFLDEEGDMVLSVSQFNMKWEDELVYENKKREESIAFLLYKDGIGEITFRRDIPFNEIDTFVDILKDEMRRASPEEDVVTKLWKADFDYISYRVLDEYLSGEFGDGSKESGAGEPSSLDSTDHAELIPIFKDEGRVILESDDSIDSMDQYFRQIIGTAGDVDGEKGESRLEEFISSTFRIGTEELKLCNEELLNEKRADGILDLMKILFDFACISGNPAVVRDITSIIDKFVDYTKVSLDPGRLIGALGAFKKMKSRPDVRSDVADYCAEKMRELSSPELLNGLAKSVTQWSTQAENLLGYYREVGEPASEVLVRMLEDATNKRLGEEICDCLVSVAGSRIDEIIDQLSYERYESAMAGIYMARKAGLKTIPNRIRELMHFPDLRVREEMIKYLSEMEDEQALGLLLKGIKDENKKIRMKALRAVEGKKHRIVRNLLHSIAFSKEFPKLDHDEKEVTFKVLGSVGDGETVARIKEMIGKKSFMHVGRNKDGKLLAIRALENMDDADALALLDGLSRDGNGLVSSRAKKALAAVKRRNKPSSTAWNEGEK